MSCQSQFCVIMICLALGFASCADMMDVDNGNALSGQYINSKTDSTFYTFGVMQTMQQLADAYVLTNELRGDLLSLTSSATTNLQDIANFSVSTSNAYDSAYVYYKVINNVNYYCAYRDTTLKTGSTNVVTNEYAAMLAFRAWAYLQAVRVFGEVKYFTYPLTTISDIENDNSPYLEIEDVARNLIADLEPYAGLSVPDYGSITAGRTNKGSTKSVSSKKCFIPVDIILGDLYLELGDEASCLKAVDRYVNYIIENKLTTKGKFSGLNEGNIWNAIENEVTIPLDYDSDGGKEYMGGTWDNYSATSEGVITYIPMAVNISVGVTSDLPKIFGYDYYSLDSAYISPQVEASGIYHGIADSTSICYPKEDASLHNQLFGEFVAGGDVRRATVLTKGPGSHQDCYYIKNYAAGNAYCNDVVLYCESTVWLHLAEALNRAGYSDLAFAILKDGLKLEIGNETNAPYISQKGRDLFAGTFFSTDYEELFADNVGIHSYGAFCTGRVNSIYQYEDKLINGGQGNDSVFVTGMVGKRFDLIKDQYGVEITSPTKADTINAVEDILCDEYAMDIPFMGNRFSDLMRMARHKNASGLYGGNFGNKWLDKKIKANNPNITKDLTVETNWYLPYN